MTQFSNNKSKEYDLEERTAKFGENIIEFVKSIKRDDINRNIIVQLVRWLPLSVLIIAKQTLPALNEISETKSIPVRRKLMRQNTG